ncbi:MAG: HK97 gp10 family phage protein, partial [Candidatus Omnitrophica bacterium]|nr:HK97 gp10 family phage protein [Candidatus Omnitrophota bacterium]
MSGIKIQIKGLAKLRKKFSVMPKHLNKELNNAVRKSVFLVEAMTKPEVPVDTGLLRGSIGTGSEGFKKFSNLRG